MCPVYNILMEWYIIERLCYIFIYTGSITLFFTLSVFIIYT